MSSQAHYFKVGLFVIGATLLLVVGIIILGAGRFFEPKLYLETYINESVQGLDVGTPVKFRGVPIGTVKEIDFVFNVYPVSSFTGGEQRAIYILMQVKPKALGQRQSESLHVLLQREVQKGLRVKLAPQGLTGLFYLELDYMNPLHHPPPQIDWSPEYHYIPSVKSTLSLFTDSITEVFGRLERFDFEGLLHDTTATLHAVQDAVAQARVGEVSRQMREAFEAVQQATDNLNTLFEEANLTQLTSNTQQLMSTIRRVVEQNEQHIAGSMRELNATMASLNSIASRFDSYLASSKGEEDLNNLRGAVAVLGEAAQSLSESVDRTLNRAEGMMDLHQHDLEIILENLRQITENLSVLTQQARDYPSQVFFGGPPPPTKTGPGK